MRNKRGFFSVVSLYLAAIFLITLGANLLSGEFPQGEIEMLGPLSKDQLLKGCPDWMGVISAYSPNPDAIDKLRAFSSEVRIEVFLGTWCPDSKSHVGELIKVLEIVDHPFLQAVYTGLPKAQAQRLPYLQGQDITKLPTFLVFVDGLEKGRIVEIPQKTVEEDLVEILER